MPNATPNGMLGHLPAPGTFMALLTPDERAGVHELGQLRRFPAGAMMMFEGEPGERVMVLVSGRAKVTRSLGGGAETLLSLRDPGDLIGELSFVDGEPRIATVAALDPVEALVIPSAAFRAHLESVPRVAMTLLEVVVRRFRDTTLKRGQFASLDTTGRLCKRLLELAERYGHEHDGLVEIDLALSQEDLTAWTGASRAGVAKALQVLRDLGWIETGRHRLAIRDVDALRKRSA